MKRQENKSPYRYRNQLQGAVPFPEGIDHSKLTSSQMAQMYQNIGSPRDKLKLKVPDKLLSPAISDHKK
jgi:hypothetical protein